MNTTELTEHLRDATAGLEPPPGFAGAVVRGGRRRRARRRLAVAASVLAVVATGATMVTLQRDDEPAPVADARLSMPTKGDLANDQAFLDEARRVWRRDLPSAPEARDRYYDDPRGEPHVYWAGNTPAGRAAIVLQPVYVHRNSQVTENGLRTAEGLVAIDTADGQLKLVGTRMIGWDAPGRADFYVFGPGDRTVLAVDYGKPLHYAFAPEIIEQNVDRVTVRIDWHRAEPDDGVAFATVPADANPRTAIVHEGGTPPEVMDTRNVPYARGTASLFLSMRLHDPSFRLSSSMLAWGEETWVVGDAVELTPEKAAWRWGRWGLGRYYVYDPESIVSLWTIVARLPDGRVFVVRETQSGTGPSRLVARVAPDSSSPTTNLVDGGTVDPDAILPVRFRIPDGGGWIVADKGKRLSYRTSQDEAWQDAGRDAALLPADTTEILVGDHYVRL